MKVKTLLLLSCLASSLSAQVYLTAGDDRLSLVQLVSLHAEGQLLTVPDVQGHSLAPAVQAALNQDPALSLQLTTQELDPKLRSGRELMALGSWTQDRPHWALVGADAKIYAEGTEAPTSTSLMAAYGHSPLHSRADTLREFLRLNPDQGEAQAQLILELRALAEQRTEKALSLLPKTEGAALLREEDDDHIWAEYADQFERFINANFWRDAAMGASSPIPFAAQLSTMGEHSRRLRDLAERLLPTVESSLRDKPSDSRRWDVWLSFRQAGAKGHAASVLAGVDPLPAARRWPPAAAVDAFVEDARQSGDWHEAEPILQASFDENEALLKKLETAAQSDAAQHGSTRVEMGSSFGFAQWNGETSLLVEAKLRLGKYEEADRLFQRVYARVPRPEFAQAASQLAQECGATNLAEKWAKQGKD